MKDINDLRRMFFNDQTFATLVKSARIYLERGLSAKEITEIFSDITKDVFSILEKGCPIAPAVYKLNNPEYIKDAIDLAEFMVSLNQEEVYDE